MSTETYILAFDIGNTNTVVGIFKPSSDLTILHHWRIATKLEYTSDELGIAMVGLISSHGFAPKNIKGLIYSSVVPSLNQTVREMARAYFPQALSKLKSVSWDMGLGLEFQYPRPEEIGRGSPGECLRSSRFVQRRFDRCGPGHSNYLLRYTRRESIYGWLHRTWFESQYGKSRQAYGPVTRHRISLPSEWNHWQFHSASLRGRFFLFLGKYSGRYPKSHA